MRLTSGKRSKDAGNALLLLPNRPRVRPLAGSSILEGGATRMITRTRSLCFCLLVLILASSFASAGDSQSANVTGKWQLSWEARMGTERGILQLEQTNSGLAGSFLGGPLGSPKISGSLEGKNINLKLAFQGTHSFTLVLTGTVDADKMSGKFEIEGLRDGYDWHGENVRPTNYSWTAVRQQPDQTQSLSQPSPPDRKQEFHQ
jgi:autotransporter translocation and assembly factor TamB